MHAFSLHPPPHPHRRARPHGLRHGDHRRLLPNLAPRSRADAPGRLGGSHRRTGCRIARARQQLEEYFARTRTTFDLPLEALGSAFEHRVWNALRQIPYGTTTSYGALAKLLGDKHATRAVGLANGKNPIPIIVPCHRVVGSKGELTGFGGGLDTKRWVLEHEGALMQLGA